MKDGQLNSFRTDNPSEDERVKEVARRIMEVYPSLYAAFESMDVRDRAFTGRGEDVEGVFRS